MEGERVFGNMMMMMMMMGEGGMLIFLAFVLKVWFRFVVLQLI